MRLKVDNPVYYKNKTEKLDSFVTFTCCILRLTDLDVNFSYYNENYIDCKILYHNI